MAKGAMNAGACIFTASFLQRRPVMSKTLPTPLNRHAVEGLGGGTKGLFRSP
jgi:hypothetical protein